MLNSHFPSEDQILRVEIETVGFCYLQNFLLSEAWDFTVTSIGAFPMRDGGVSAADGASESSCSTEKLNDVLRRGEVHWIRLV